MNKGFIQQADNPVTLFEDPVNLFVATFLGTPQMNIIECELVEKGEKVGAKLEGVEGNTIWFKDETVKQIKNSGLDFEKKYLFGIRPDHIKIGEKGIDAHVEAVEQLGDETIIYTSIAGHKGHVILKSALVTHVNAGEDVKLDFDMQRVYLFDKQSEHSLIGMPSFNKLPCVLEGKTMKVGKSNIELDDEYVSHLLSGAYTGNRYLAIKPEYIEFEQTESNRPLKVKVDFIEPRTNYNIIFSQVDGVKPYLIFKANKERVIKVGDQLEIYLPLEHIAVYDDNDDSYYSREVAYPNVAYAKVTSKNGKTSVAIKNGETLVYDDLKVADGDYKFILKQDKCEPIYTRKVAKTIAEEVPTKVNKGEYLSLSCYDEEPQHKINTIFVKIKGFEEYVTLNIENKFSVYKMPAFKIRVPADAFDLEPVAKETTVEEVEEKGE